MADTLSLKTLKAELDALALRVDSLTSVKEPSVVAPVIPAHTAPSEPVPVDYREVVDTVLNQHFGIRIETRTDAPLFTFTIVVPERYSTLSPNEKELKHEDLRPKVMSFADGSAGVRMWAERVFENFNPQIKAQIVADKVAFV